MTGAPIALAVGDQVLTRDGDVRTVVWAKTLTDAELSPGGLLDVNADLAWTTENGAAR